MVASGAEWMIAGGVAAIVYGEPRLTQDIDVVAAIRAEDAARFAAQFPSTDFYCPPVEAIAEEARREAFGHFNLLHLESDVAPTSTLPVRIRSRAAVSMRAAPWTWLASRYRSRHRNT